MTGRVAVITGGAQGIGNACARRFAEAGYTVILSDRDATAGSRAAEAIGATFVECDVSVASDVADLGRQVAAVPGRTEALVHAAGITHPMIGPDEFEDEFYRKVLDVDLMGTFLVCREMARQFEGGGAIVTLGSSAATTVLRLHAYGPAKAGVLALTRQLAQEYGKAGIRVNAISPGYVLTPTLEHAFEEGRRSRAKLEARSVQNRLLEPSEIADVALFLASEAGRGITGQNIVVDAGFGLTGHWDIMSDA